MLAEFPNIALSNMAIVDFINPSVFTSVFSQLLPRLIFAIIVFIVGLVAGIFIKRLLLILFEKLEIEKAFKEKWAERKVEELEKKRGVSELLGDLTKYFIYILSILIALNILGLTAIQPLITSVFSYIPSIISAGIIFFLGLILAEVLGRIVGDAIEGMGGRKFTEHHGFPFTAPEFLESFTKFFIILIAIIMALDQLGISTQVLNLTFLTILSIAGGGALIFLVFLLYYSYEDLMAGPKLRELGEVKYEGKDVEVEEIGPVYTRFKIEKEVRIEKNSEFLKKVRKK